MILVGRQMCVFHQAKEASFLKGVQANVGGASDGRSPRKNGLNPASERKYQENLFKSKSCFDKYGCRCSTGPCYTTAVGGERAPGTTCQLAGRGSR